RRYARSGGRRLATLRGAGGADRQDRRTRALHRSWHLGRRSAPLRHEPLQGHRGREQGRRRPDIQGGRLRHRRRRGERWPSDRGSGEGYARHVMERRGFVVRHAARRDLESLVKLEEGFPGDRISRASLSRLLSRESAEIFVAEAGEEVVGDAIVLFRSGFKTARLYSMIVSPAVRGRGGARSLLA